MKSLLVHMNLKVGFAAGIILVVVTTLTIVSLRNEKNVTDQAADNVRQSQQRSFVMHDAPRPLCRYRFRQRKG